MSIFSELIRVRGHTIWTRALTQDSVVIDGGAHRGEFSHAIHDRFGCRCVLVEANPSLARDLRPPPGGQVVHVALGATDGVSRFVFSDNIEHGHITDRKVDPRDHTAEVETLSLPTLLRRCGVPRLDLLKLDIEGAEFPLLEHTPDAVLADIGQITIEFHDFIAEFKGRGLFEAARARLERVGFVCCPMAFRTHGDVLFLNRGKVDLSRGALMMLATLGRWVLKTRS